MAQAVPEQIMAPVGRDGDNICQKVPFRVHSPATALGMDAAIAPVTRSPACEPGKDPVQPGLHPVGIVGSIGGRSEPEVRVEERIAAV